ncbi:signal transduction histidine kinase [Streptomyces lincolnensis]|uniref:Oxygen sensor histidine kinase NreB n=2 Tax=Streptomyces lincolnensis TaxID=1915 RepID=A0A1B1M2H9_STRLN|nr:signal transduction histidine kinase [Streptomyces lincolnensis]AXG51779.1 signal transduction histidine kinase [Streptomyces lincolnensis]
MVMAQQQARERWQAALQHAFFLTVLALSVLGALAGTDMTAGAALPQVGLAVGFIAWYAYWIVLRGGADRPPLPYLIGAAVGWAAMAAVDPALLPVGLAVLAPYCLRRAGWSAAGVLVVGALWLWQRFATVGYVDVREFWGCALGMAAAVTIVGYIATLEREGHKRQRLLDELTATQAERAAAERTAGVLAERQRLAREVHDTLTQGFASIAMLLDSVRDELAPGAPAARRVDQAMRTARDNLAESRRLVHALRPAPLDDTPLTDAVRELTGRLAEETGIEAFATVTGQPAALPAGTEGELLRVVQEALTNARRHAQAASVSVTLSYLDDVLAIDIQDDGTGFTPATRHPGVGMTTMRERIASVGGVFAVESAPGEGTTVTITMPLPAVSPTGEATSGSADTSTHDAPNSATRTTSTVMAP